MQTNNSFKIKSNKTQYFLLKHLKSQQREQSLLTMNKLQTLLHIEFFPSTSEEIASFFYQKRISRQVINCASKYEAKDICLQQILQKHVKRNSF